MGVVLGFMSVPTPIDYKLSQGRHLALVCCYVFARSEGLGAPWQAHWRDWEGQEAGKGPSGMAGERRGVRREGRSSWGRGGSQEEAVAASWTYGKGKTQFLQPPFVKPYLHEGIGWICLDKIGCFSSARIFAMSLSLKSFKPEF